VLTAFLGVPMLLYLLRRGVADQPQA
jgi:ABC-type Fe3+-siderophore transport system permease subunit